jgi:hypothetical protein
VYNHAAQYWPIVCIVVPIHPSFLLFVRAFFCFFIIIIFIFIFDVSLSNGLQKFLCFDNAMRTSSCKGLHVKEVPSRKPLLVKAFLNHMGKHDIYYGRGVAATDGVFLNPTSQRRGFFKQLVSWLQYHEFW